MLTDTIQDSATFGPRIEPTGRKGPAAEHCVVSQLLPQHTGGVRHRRYGELCVDDGGRAAGGRELYFSLLKAARTDFRPIRSCRWLDATPDPPPWAVLASRASTRSESTPVTGHKRRLGDRSRRAYTTPCWTRGPSLRDDNRVAEPNRGLPGQRRRCNRDHERRGDSAISRARISLSAQGGFLARLTARVNRGASWALDLLPGRSIDAELLDDLETRLISADVGVEATEAILENLRRRLRRELGDAEALGRALRAPGGDTCAGCAVPLAIDRSRRPSSSWSWASMARARRPPSASWRCDWGRGHVR